MPGMAETGGARKLLADLIARVVDLIDRITWLGQQQESGTQGDAENVAAVEAQTAAIVGAINGQTSAQLAANALLARAPTWTAMADGGALLLGTTAKVLRAAPAAGQRSYLTALQMANTNALTTARVEVLDGATVVWAGVVPPNTTLGFPVALVSTAATALNVRLGAALTGGVLVNAQGYTST